MEQWQRAKLHNTDHLKVAVCAAILERLVTRYQLDAESAGKFGSRTLLTSYGCGPQFLAGGSANISGFKDLGKPSTNG